MKLKPIPSNTVVHTPTEAEAKELLAILHENGYNFTPTYESLVEINRGWGYPSTMCFSFDKHHCIDHCDRSYYEELGCTILTLAEFKERYVLNEDNFIKSEEKPQPKFNKGDKAIVVTNKYGLKGLVGGVCKITEVLPHGYHLMSPTGFWYATESDLEPYTEPETKEETMETKENRNLSQDVANCDNPEDKELNLCELLKGHEGEKFFSPISNNPLKLKAVFGRSLAFFLDEEDDLSIDFDGGGRITITSLNDVSQLKYITDPKSQCLLFPSHALYEQYPLDPYTAWMKWQEKQKKQKKHYVSVTVWIDGLGTELVQALDTDNIYFRTLADRDKCIEEIKAIIEKYSKK